MPPEDASDHDLEGTPALDQARARVGAVLRGKWKLDRVIGIGGMGAVYAATHRNGRRCAIKVLLPLHGADRKTVQRFLKEGYVANEIGHPDTVEIHDDDFTDDGLPFLVMELLEGESLTERLEKPPHRLHGAEAVAIAIQLLDVLEAAHARGIVHRDVKPDNVFVLASGRLKLLDFGIARLRTVTAAGTSTASGALLGTPSFMAPEQARGRTDEVDARSDVFGVGATLFYALSGQNVRDAETVNELLLHAMTEPAKPLSSVAPEVRPDLAAVVDRALAFAREERWASAAAMRDALAALTPDEAGAPVISLRTTSAPARPHARITPASDRARARNALDATVAASEPVTTPPAAPLGAERSVMGRVPGSRFLVGAAVVTVALLGATLAARRVGRPNGDGTPGALPPPSSSSSSLAVAPVVSAAVLPARVPSDSAGSRPAPAPEPVTAAASTVRPPSPATRHTPKAPPSTAPPEPPTPVPSSPPTPSADPLRRRL